MAQRPKAAAKATTRHAPPKAASDARRKRTTGAAGRGADGTTFGRPGTAGKGEGASAVRAWIAGVRPNHRALVERLDALVGDEVPDVRRAVKWSMPTYGVAGRGWFAHIGSFKQHVALGFFAGTDLNPRPPNGEGKGMRRLNLRGPEDLDEAQVRAWIRQAAQLPGWGKA